MSSKAFLLLGLLLAIILLISSEVAARDLAETSSDQNNVEATKEANGVDVAKYGGYGGNPGGGYGGYPEPEGRHPRTLASGGNGGCGDSGCCRPTFGSKGCNRCCAPGWVCAPRHFGFEEV